MEQLIASPVGTLRLCEQDGCITGVYFAKQTQPDTAPCDSLILQQAVQQLNEYFQGERKTFQLPLAPKGTPFQMRVWQALQSIPYGVTWSYKQLAEAAGSPKGYRAAGLANNRNPISIIIPCHRVIGADGSLTGYGGGLEIKALLLELENKYDR